jgi:hypothetical protein
MKFHSLLPFAFIIAPAHADIIWTGTTSNDVFDESNWDFTGSSVTTIDPNVTIEDNLVIANAANPVEIPDIGGQGRLQLGDGWSLTVDNSSLTSLGNDGVGGVPGTFNGPTIRVINGGAFNPYFIVNDVHLEIVQWSSATFGGPGNPVNLSSIDLLPNGTLAFLDETVQEYINEHLNKTTVAGVPAIIGVNITAVSDGLNGSIIEVISALGTNYCIAIANSTGAAAVMSADGSIHASHNNLTLTARGMPTNQLGYFLCGQAQGYIPNPGNSQGSLCLIGRIGRFAGQIQDTGALGEYSIQVDLGAVPVWRPHAVLPGETWNFQAWFVDGGSSNFSDGLSITFQ